MTAFLISAALVVLAMVLGFMAGRVHEANLTLSTLEAMAEKIEAGDAPSVWAEHRELSAAVIRGLVAGMKQFPQNAGWRR